MAVKRRTVIGDGWCTATEWRLSSGRCVGCAAALGLVATLGVVLLAGLFGASSAASSCTPATGGAAGSIALLAPGSGARVAATLYGGPGDSVSGSVGSSGVNLYQHPDSYAELGGYDLPDRDALGGLPYETPLRITYGGHSVIAYKRDIGFGGPPIDGLPRTIDLWFELAEALRIPGAADDDWAGPVRVQRLPATGAGNALAQTPSRSTDVRRPGRKRLGVRAGRSRRRSRSRPDRARGCWATDARQRRRARRRRSRGSSPPATRSSASPTSTAAATGCR